MENKKALKALLIFISYFIYSSFQALPLKLVGIDYNNMSLNSKVIHILIYELLYILVLIFLLCVKIRLKFYFFHYCLVE